jgi:CheY-like chemotaxis protein
MTALIRNLFGETQRDAIVAALKPVEEHASGNGTREPSVLLATNRPSLARAARVAALALGLALYVSPDGLHALMSAVRQEPDLILLDPALTGVDADTVERMLGRDGRTAGIPTVRVSETTSNGTPNLAPAACVS